MRRRAETVLIALLVAGAAIAQDPAPPPDTLAERLRPTGAVTVKGDHAEWEKSGMMIWTGHVSLESQNLDMKGDRLELRQKESGQYEALLTGVPARMDHAGEPGGPAETAEPVSAEARTLFYDTAQGLVQLTGGAHLTRGKDQIKGESIRYDVAARRIRATGGEDGQVTVILQPPPPKAADDKPAKPAKPAKP